MLYCWDPSNKNVTNSKPLPQPGDCEIPNAEFDAEFCGSDDENFIFIRPLSSLDSDKYSKLSALIKSQKYSIFDTKTSTEKLIPGMAVMVKEDGRFYRATIARIHKDEDIIQAFKIDEGCSTDCLRNQVYRATPALLEIPCCTIKCRLQGLGIFDGFPCLGLAYKWIKMKEMINQPTRYVVQIVSLNKDSIPIVEIKTGNGLSLLNEIQKLMPMLCEPRLPKRNLSYDAEISCVNYKACIYYRIIGEDNLHRRISETLKNLPKNMISDKLREINPTTPAPAPMRIRRRMIKGFYRLELMESIALECPGRYPQFSMSKKYEEQHKKLPPDQQWKEKYFKLPTGIFLAELGDILYRVKATRLLNKTMVEVQYIDYANTNIINRSSLIPVWLIDENLAFIPPQCLKARFYGFYAIDEDRLWSQVSKKQGANIKIILKDKQEEMGDEIEIFTSISEDPNVSLNESWRNDEDVLNSYTVKPIPIQELERLKSTAFVLSMTNQNGQLLKEPWNL